MLHCANYCANFQNIALIFKTLRQWPKLTEKTASDFGYACFICYSAVEAIDKIKGYYNLSN